MSRTGANTRLVGCWFYAPGYGEPTLVVNPPKPATLHRYGVRATWYRRTLAIRSHGLHMGNTMITVLTLSQFTTESVAAAPNLTNHNLA